MVIKDFSEDLFYLDNTYPFPVEYEGIVYDSLAAAFVAAKTDVEAQRRAISHMDFYQADHYFKENCRTSKDFIANKREIFLTIFHEKFDKNEDDHLVRFLIATTGRDDTFIYENTECDNFLGVCTCSKCKGRHGVNLLGVALTELRHKYE